MYRNICISIFFHFLKTALVRICGVGPNHSKGTNLVLLLKQILFFVDVGEFMVVFLVLICVNPGLFVRFYFIWLL